MQPPNVSMAGPALPHPDIATLTRAFKERGARVAVIGMGYVGIPLAESLVRNGFSVTGVDIDQTKVDRLNAGKSYLHHIADERIAAMRTHEKLQATTDFADLRAVHAIIICVPTPWDHAGKAPVLTFIEAAAEAMVPHLQPGQLIVLESSTFPGTTVEVLKPILERSGLKSGQDFFLAFSPEREDPGNKNFSTSTIPKVVGGDGQAALQLATALYEQCIDTVVPVSRPEIAEAAKLLENTFRAVNIALINEVKVVLDAMGLDVWEVVEAAKSKPFGFMPFYPSPGIGGHCIPVDPLYLTWKAKQHGIDTRFITLADEVNHSMPGFVIARLEKALHHNFGKTLRGAAILILGIAYKKNVEDTRESPAFRMAELLQANGAAVSYYDPIVAHVEIDAEHQPPLAGQSSIIWDVPALKNYDAAIIMADHDAIDYTALTMHCPLVVDTRNALKNMKQSAAIIVKA